MKKIENRIIKILSQVLEIPKRDISINASFDDLDNWDSLNHMKMVVAIEEEFGVVFDENRIMEMTSVRDILDSVNDYVKKR